MVYTNQYTSEYQGAGAENPSMVASGGSVAVASPATALNFGGLLGLDPESYDVAGGDVSFFLDYLIYAWGGVQSDVYVGFVAPPSPPPWGWTLVDLYYHQIFNVDGGSVSVAGTGIGGELTFSTQGHSLLVSGSDATLGHNLFLTSETYSLVVQGKDASLSYQRTIMAQAGSITIVGGDSQSIRSMPADSGSTSVDGSTAATLLNPVLDAEDGKLLIQGTPTGIYIPSDSESVEVNGSDTTLTPPVRFSCSSYSLGISGEGANLFAHRVIAPDFAKIIYVGHPVTFGTVILVGSGSVAVSALDTTLDRIRILMAEGATVAIRVSDSFFFFVEPELSETLYAEINEDTVSSQIHQPILQGPYPTDLEAVLL